MLIPTADGSTLADILNQVAWNYRDIDLDSAMIYADSAFEISSANNYYRGINEGLNFKGVIFRNMSNYSKAQVLLRT